MQSLSSPSGISLNDVVNSHTLNIFCDASHTRVSATHTKGSFGAVAVSQQGTVKEALYKIEDKPINELELMAIRTAVEVAAAQRHAFRKINIFSDNKAAVNGLKNGIIKWKTDPKTGEYKSVSTNKTITAQEVLLHIVNIILKHNLKLTLYHQKAHTTPCINSLQRSAIMFKTSNKIAGAIDLDLIRYISVWNRETDWKVGALLRNSNAPFLKDDLTEYYPHEFDKRKYCSLVS